MLSISSNQNRGIKTGLMINKNNSIFIKIKNNHFNLQIKAKVYTKCTKIKRNLLWKYIQFTKF